MAAAAHVNRLSLILLLASGATASPALGQFSLTASTYSQDFNTLGTGTTNVASGHLSSINPALNGWFFLESGSNANTSIAGGNGSNSAGDTYKAGETSNAERALGGLQSGSLIPTWGFYVSNDTGADILALRVSYRGEQWRIGATGRSDRLDLQYSMTATSLAGTGFVDFDALDYSPPPSPVTASGSEQHSETVAATLPLTISSGSSIFFRWSDFNATGGDDLLAVDDFSLLVLGPQYWDPNGGGTGVGGNGTWDTTNLRWNQNSTGTGGTVLQYVSVLPTVFHGPVGNVTVNATIPVANSVTFNTSGYEISGAGALALDSGASIVVTDAAHTATLSTKLTGAAALIKSGAGQLIITSSANDYTGGTQVNGGRLSVNSPGVIPGNVSINTGGTLGGTGNVSGTVAIAGMIAPGQSVGELTTGGQTWQSGGTYEWEIADVDDGPGNGWDHLQMSSLSITATNAAKFVVKLVSVNGANPPAGFPVDGHPAFPPGFLEWTIATSDTAISGFDPEAFEIDAGGFEGTHPQGHFKVYLASGDTQLRISYVPEPAGVSAIALLAGMMLRRRKR